MLDTYFDKHVVTLSKTHLIFDVLYTLLALYQVFWNIFLFFFINCTQQYYESLWIHIFIFWWQPKLHFVLSCSNVLKLSRKESHRIQSACSSYTIHILLMSPLLSTTNVTWWCKKSCQWTIINPANESRHLQKFHWTKENSQLNIQYSGKCRGIHHSYQFFIWRLAKDISTLFLNYFSLYTQERRKRL